MQSPARSAEILNVLLVSLCYVMQTHSQVHVGFVCILALITSGSSPGYGLSELHEALSMHVLL